MKNLNYGIIGNCQSAALVSDKGFIDWCCLPAFDSPSIFASILDKNKGGTFGIIVDESYEITQKYLPRTNILKTTFNNGTDKFEVLDFMPRYRDECEGVYMPPDIIRYFRPKSGKPKFKIVYDPQLEYAEGETKHKVINGYIKSYTNEAIYDSLYLYTNFNRRKILAGEEVTLTNDAFFLLSYHQKILVQNVDRIYAKLQRTKVYWLNWSERTKTYAHYNNEILRSALVLKLLSYDKTGAILAAATTSLPETIGEERNWDYRFCWLRDSAMVVKVMTELGHHRIVKRYLQFLLDIMPDKSEKVQIMYGINREKTLTESSLSQFEGYEGSTPVRIGNDAYRQKQHDIYGIIMDAIYQQFKLFESTLQNSEELWTMIRSIIRIVEENWQSPDRGIWEIRTDNKHFTFSKLLCWVAVDRAQKIAELLHMYHYVEEWQVLKYAIRKDIELKAWNNEVGAFTQFYNSTDLDAATLLMEPLGFIDASDPRYIKTVKATGDLLLKDGLMYRYKNKDDFGEPSSSFTICTFWYINSLYAIGEKDKARALFGRLLSYSNHLNLFSEDIDFNSKRLLGNFPQAYSHLALIETAIKLTGGKLASEEEIMDVILH